MISLPKGDLLEASDYYFFFKSDASVKTIIITASNGSNSILFTQGIPIMAYHTHDTPGNIDYTIEFCELFIASGNYYVSMYSWIGNNLVSYANCSFVIFYI